MGELKAIGSEKLNGDEKIKRILELTYFQTNNKVNESTSDSPEVIKETKSGVYGIVREKDGYYVKKGLNENSLDYIGGMFMKNKNKFSSHMEALKKMEFLVEQEGGSTEEVIEEATKYVLKQKKPVAPIEPAAPPTEEPIDAAPVAPVDDAPPVDDGLGDEMPEEGGEDDHMKVLQKMAGKLQQKINKYDDRLESADYKAVIKQVLSAVDLDKLEEADKEDILSMFEDEVADPGAEPMDDFPTDNQGEVPAPQETAETDGMSSDGLDGIASLEELIDTPLDEFDEFGDFENDMEDDSLSGFDDEFLNDPEIAKAGKMAKKDSGGEFKLDHEKDTIDFGKEADEFPEWKPRDEEDVEEGLPIQGMGEEEDVDVELDLDELTDMVNSSVKETLGKYFE